MARGPPKVATFASWRCWSQNRGPFLDVCTLSAPGCSCFPRTCSGDFHGTEYSRREARIHASSTDAWHSDGRESGLCQGAAHNRSPRTVSTRNCLDLGTRAFPRASPLRPHRPVHGPPAASTRRALRPTFISRRENEAPSGWGWVGGGGEGGDGPSAVPPALGAGHASKLPFRSH